MDIPAGYVLIERERFERLVAAAMLGSDDELFPSMLEPGDLDDIDDAHAGPPAE